MMSSLSVQDVADRCYAVYDLALELSTLLDGIEQMQEKGSAFWSLARQAQRLTASVDSLHQDILSLKAKTPGKEEDPGLSNHNPIKGGSNHGFSQV